MIKVVVGERGFEFKKLIIILAIVWSVIALRQRIINEIK